MSELKDWICYRDQNGVGFTHSWLSIGAGPYCCTRCGKQMPADPAPIPCPQPTPMMMGPDYKALAADLAEALRGLLANTALPYIATSDYGLARSEAGRALSAYDSASGEGRAAKGDEQT